MERRRQLRTYASYGNATEDSSILTHSPSWIVGSSAAIQIVRHCYLSLEPQLVGGMKSDLGQYTHPTFITNVVFTSKEFALDGLFKPGHTTSLPSSRGCRATGI